MAKKTNKTEFMFKLSDKSDVFMKFESKMESEKFMKSVTSLFKKIC